MNAPTTADISRTLRRHAAERPDARALVAATGPGATPWREITWAELDALVDATAHGLHDRGVRRGDRALFLVKPGIDFYATFFALLRIGAIPVLIDPGMGLRGVLACVRSIRPRVVVALPVVHALRQVLRAPFASSEIHVTAGRRWFWGGPTLEACRTEGRGRFEAEPLGPASEALIAFTSGSTGPAKPVVFTHGAMDVQARLIGGRYALTPGMVTVECFAAFALYDLLLGLTVVLPWLDMSKPARADPAEIVRAITEHRAACAFASPVIWSNLVRWADGRTVSLPTLKAVLTAGAPIGPDLHRRLRPLLAPGVELFTPYGATECLPVASVGSNEVLDETAARTAAGEGTCVGTLFLEADVRIIAVSDDPIPTWTDDLCLPTGEIGEVVVKGPMASPEYKERPEANAAAKIPDEGHPIHRMGDLGYLDDRGRLWFCGRKSHRVLTATGMVPAVPIEGVFNAHGRVLRTALVGVGEPGAQVPVLCVEMEQGEAFDEAVEAELRALAEPTRWAGVVDRFLVHAGFPVDPRHNSKIRREVLREWATSQIAARGAP